MSLSLSEQAYQAMKSDIITCVLPPGLQIAQSQLADRYNVGVTPIREALQRLFVEGFVRPIPRFGYIITPITVKDIHDIYELRLILETSAVRLAAERGTDEQLSHIREKSNFTYVYGDRQSYRDFLSANTAFHASIAMLAGNQRLADAISKLLDEMVRIFHLGLELRDSAAEMRAEHLELIAALTKRDVDLAVELTRKQIVVSKQRVLEMLTQQAADVLFTGHLSSVPQVPAGTHFAKE